MGGPRPLSLAQYGVRGDAHAVHHGGDLLRHRPPRRAVGERLRDPAPPRIGHDRQVRRACLLLGLPAGHKFQPKQRHTRPTLRQWALETIYAARDDYLHGNPVADDRLKLPSTDYDLSAYASLLYRVLLVQFLNLQLPLPPFDLSSVEVQRAAGKPISDRISFERYSDKIEDALYTMCGQLPLCLLKIPKARQV